jgi:2-polyprenyl-3-methyl-5-hydroxy-6-metoxy-1,4-benzoquinol methylase
MPLLSDYARKKKIYYFLESIPKEARILEVGCGSGWALEYLRGQGWQHSWGVDIRPPADYVGDIRRWRELGLDSESFDVIIAFEVVEHVACFRECYDLLKPGGKLLLTSPLPRMDWFMKLLETLGLNQKRTSPHDCLVDFATVPEFERKDIRIVGCLSQWGVFHKIPV